MHTYTLSTNAYIHISIRSWTDRFAQRLSKERSCHDRQSLGGGGEGLGLGLGSGFELRIGFGFGFVFAFGFGLGFGLGFGFRLGLKIGLGSHILGLIPRLLYSLWEWG